MKKLLACVTFSLLIPCSLAAGTIEDITARAEFGDAGAQFVLATMYEHADGVAKDDSAALQWYTKAADLGNVDAKFRLAQRYKNGVGKGGEGKDPQRAFAYAKNAAELGHPMAQFLVGIMYLRGIGVDSNVASGMQWLVTSAEQDTAIAQYFLGSIYMKGDFGLGKDWQKAIEWFKRSSLIQEDPRLDLWHIGFMYHEGGYGVAQDVDESMKWFAVTGQDRKGAEELIAYFRQNYMGIAENYAKSPPL